MVCVSCVFLIFSLFIQEIILQQTKYKAKSASSDLLEEIPLRDGTSFVYFLYDDL